MPKRIDDIELLRAFAVLLVILEHAHGNLITWQSAIFDRFNQHFNGGAGVDLFFAISGFVIARDLLPKLAGSTSWESFKNISFAFWIRRVWRILPSAWLWLAVILLATVFFNRSGAFRSFDAAFAGTIAAILQFYNFHFANCFMAYDCGANFVYWSLSLEEQFYLALPFVIFVSRRWLFPLLACLIAFQLISHRSLLLVMFRTDALLLGVLIAMWSAQPGFRLFEPRGLANSRLARLLLTLGLVIGLATAATNQWWLASYRFGIVAVISACLVWLASFDGNYLLAPSFIKQAMIWIGSRSYAIYLIHIPAFFMTREFWFRIEPRGNVFDAAYAVPYLLTATFILLALSEINYRLIETPLRRKGAAIAARMMESTSTTSSHGFSGKTIE